MKKIFAVMALVATMFAVSGCTSPIPPGNLGKLITSSGITPEVYEPGRPTVWGRDRLILIETASELRKAPVRVVMADRSTNDKTGVVEHQIGLEMDFLVNTRYRLNTDPKVINSMMSDMSLEGVDRISVKQVYQKYGDMVIGQVSREVLGQYTPEEVLGNLETINKTLDRDVKKALASSPLVVSSVSLGPIKLPSIITARVNANKDTELSEAQKRAQQKIDLLEKQNEIELARQQAIREEIEAKSIANQNAILSESITPEVLELRRLQIQDREIEMQREVLTKGLAQGNSSVFIPFGMQNDVGVSNRVFSK